MTDPAREGRLRELFDRACALPAGPRRDAMVADVDDEVLRERLRALLLQDAGGTGTLLREGAAAALQALRRIGPYEVLRELGTGGMGTVWVARQVEPVERLVALKLIRRDVDSAPVIERFALERQTMALMQHPGIATMYDAGTAADGALWFAMELVRGEPITTWCDRRGLDVAGRVRLFAGVCDAVQHAHQKGVLHRDLKPGNVLVAGTGDEAQAKIIDFGVARALLRAPGQRLLPGGDDEIVGTWHYMSPEQADPTNADVDSRSDIWSLGVMLYELLTGELPLVGDPADVGRGDAEAFWRFRAVLLQQTPPRASERVAALDAARAHACAQRRGTTPARLRRRLRGDLDAILATALAKDRAARYASASELRADLLRHLRGEAVGVVPPTLRYRVATFVRRNRAFAAAGAFAVLALVAALAATTWALWLERDARIAADRAHARDVAALQADLARGDFFRLLLLYGDPGTGRTPPTLRDVLDRLEPSIARRWAGRPAAQATLRTALGRAYLELGEPQRAEPQLLAAWQATVPQEDPVGAFLLLNDLARAVAKVRGAAAAREHEVRMLELGVTALARDWPALSRTFAELARLVQDPAKQAECAARCEDAIAQVAGLPPDDGALRIAGPLLVLFATTLQDHGQRPGGRAVLTDLERAVRQAIADEAELLPILARYADHLLDVGDLAGAQRLAGEVLDALEAAGFHDHWLRVQVDRVRGLALAIGGEIGGGETVLCALRDELEDCPPGANEQVRRAAAALPELCERLRETARLDAFLDASLGLWRQRTAGEAAPRPWWPADTAGVPVPALQAALAIVERAGPPDAALHGVHGALLLRLERFAAALEQLEAAQRASAAPAPELLADLVLACRSAGRAADADAAQARLTELPADDARAQRARARAAAVRR